MMVAEASARANVRFELHDPQADQAALLKMAAWCEQFSPVVGIEGTDNLCLDVAGIGQLFGGEEALVQQVKRAFDRLRLEARLAVADTLGAAWAFAHFDGDVLEDLPIAAMRLDDVEILAELGIYQIGQLLTIPREAIAARFNPDVLRRLDQATGFLAEPIVSHRPPPDIVVEKLLEFPTDKRQVLDAILDELTKSVCDELIERQEGVIQLECQLHCESGDPIKTLVGVYRATAHAKHLLELTVLQLDRLTLPGPILRVKLSVLISAPLESRQQELFEASDQEGRRQVSLLVDRLSNRLGRNNVVRAVPQAEAQPELAIRYEPLAGVRPRTRKDYEPRHLPRPLRLEREPVLLKMFTTFPDGAPGQFEWEGSHRVERSWGPERIQTAWWRGEYVQRDYYRVETIQGRRFWLFRRLRDGEWFLHGVFD
jgi:protein ImuB